jgi:tetratricopeptide (TPR) repeat protein
MSAINSSPGRKRLDSWKEIASFFGRDERTVNRWEKELGLPVHRLPGTKGRVYAYAEELSAWLAASKSADAATLERDAAALSETSQAAERMEPAGSGLTVIHGGRTALDSRVSTEPERAPRETMDPASRSVPAASASHSRSTISRSTIRLAAAAILGMGAMALVLFLPIIGRNSKTATPPVSTPRPNSPSSVVLASTPAHDPQAEQLYLKGRYYWDKRTPEDLNKALDFFMQAVVHDPNYSQAYVGLADCYNLMREFTLMPSNEAYPRALAAAKKAVELDDQSSEAHASLAFVSFFGMWDIATGEREFRRAIDLNPNNATSHHWYANALFAMHRMPEALAEIDRAQALDPASTSILADKGNILFRDGQQDEAITLLKQMESREPAFRSPHGYLKGAYLGARDYPDYLSEWRKDALLMHDDSELAMVTAAEKGFAAGGPHAMFEATLQVQKKLYAQNLVSPTTLAQTFALLGNKPEALRYLEIAYKQRDSLLLFVQIFPEFDSLHDEPVYRDLLAKMNLPVERVERAAKR